MGFEQIILEQTILEQTILKSEGLETQDSRNQDSRNQDSRTQDSWNQDSWNQDSQNEALKNEALQNQEFESQKLESQQLQSHGLQSHGLQSQQFENEFRAFFLAKSENEGLARMMTSAFLTQYDPTVAVINDIKTAVSEAVTNAIIHGYEKAGGQVELFCGYKEGILYIEVADHGLGIDNVDLAREPLYTSKPELERSGMGFTIMETFMDSVHIETKMEEGTRIYMEKKLMEE